MKVIILSSGTGRRLLPLTANTPKSLIDLGNGRTLLETQIENISKSKVIDEIVLVIGYCADQVEAKIKKYRKEGLLIKTVYNPFYEVSNNLMTLWMAKHEMNDDFMITNGDNIFESAVFSELATKNKNGIFLTTSFRESYGEDDMKVIIEDGLIEKVSKQIPGDRASAESVGLTLISGDKYREIFKNNLEELAREPEYVQKFWLEVFNRMISKGVRVAPFEIDGKKSWIEIDFHGDLSDVIRGLMEKKLSKLSGEQAHNIRKDINSLNNPRLKEERVMDIIESVPRTHEDLANIIGKDALSDVESQQVLSIIERHLTR